MLSSSPEDITLPHSSRCTLMRFHRESGKFLGSSQYSLLPQKNYPTHEGIYELGLYREVPRIAGKLLGLQCWNLGPVLLRESTGTVV